MSTSVGAIENLEEGDEAGEVENVRGGNEAEDVEGEEVDEAVEEGGGRCMQQIGRAHV